MKGSEWKEKAENLETELQQCYKAQSRLSEQLVVEVAESRASKALLQEKESLITSLQEELVQTRFVHFFFLFIMFLDACEIKLIIYCRDECTELKADLEEKIKALELVVSENQQIRAQLEEITIKAKTAEAENKMLIDRWMLQKMQDAERLNEVFGILVFSKTWR